MKYPVWQYPIIAFFLLKYLASWRFRVWKIIKWRQAIGLIPEDRNPTFGEISQFGHWLVSEEFLHQWHKGG